MTNFSDISCGSAMWKDSVRAMAGAAAGVRGLDEGRGGFNGQAFRRSSKYDPTDAALRVAAKITAKLDEVAPMMHRLGHLGYDGGGQPACANAWKPTVDDAGHQRVRDGHAHIGETFRATIESVGPNEDARTFLVTRPKEAGLRGRADRGVRALRGGSATPVLPGRGCCDDERARECRGDAD